MIRKTYVSRLIGRCLILLGCIWLVTEDSDQLRTLTDEGFFHSFSLLHLLWAFWVFDMISQLFPIGRRIALGSRKVFANAFRAAEHRAPIEQLKAYTRASGRKALLVFLVWSALIAVLGRLHTGKILSDAALFLISVIFYVCDLICVLVWWPFRLMLGNRCCTTCRIFNWDHIMMFSPMLFLDSFFARSLNFMAVLAFLGWELTVLLHPERFSSQTNAALRCTNCTDKLCTQYCEKGRRAAVKIP
ncbi:MAG: hypothetical protein IJ042_07900 [Butyricicoccus sp.]|nr:hypothetical protein [Butyricicoccus sp.]